MGKLVLDLHNWQGIFYIQIVISLLVALWFWKRQEETLSEENKMRFSFAVIGTGFREVLKQKRSMGYTLISGLVVGSFLVYLSSSQQIFQEQYGLKDEFPYIFAGLAIAIGTAIFLNGSFVLKYGMKRLVSLSLVGYFATSLLYMLLFFGSDNPSIYVLLVFFGIQFFCVGFLFGNLRALAMEPLGHIAGIGSAVTGFIATMMAVPISTWIGRFVGATALPLFIGFAICSFLAVLILLYLRKK
jgi:DHA1 family bicyclomycin/chloramphenicol resistance-like MFS transporter